MKFRSLHIILSVAAMLTLAISMPFGARAQTFRGGINGTITDQSGAVVAGAAVEATEVATNISHKSISSSGGEFSFQEIPLGAYTITVEASGFRTEKVNNIPVAAGVIYTLPVKLIVASAGTQTVEVSAAAYCLCLYARIQANGGTRDIHREGAYGADRETPHLRGGR